MDYDRYVSALFASHRERPHLIALYAFHYEIARIAETVHRPIAGQIRLQWWREAIAELFAGSVRRHEVVEALAAALRQHALPQALFQAMIDARENDLIESPFGDIAALEAYADATSGHLMRLAARILGAGDSLDPSAGAAGTAYALAGLLRSIALHAAHRRLMLPAGLLAEHDVEPEDVFAARASAALGAVIAVVADRARRHWAQACQAKVPRRQLPALLVGACVPLQLRAVEKARFSPFREPADVPVHRRQLAMLGAMLKGHV